VGLLDHLLNNLVLDDFLDVQMVVSAFEFEQEGSKVDTCLQVEILQELSKHILQFDSVVFEKVEVIADCRQQVIVLLGLLQVVIENSDCRLLLRLKLRFLSRLGLGAAPVNLDEAVFFCVFL